MRRLLSRHAASTINELIGQLYTEGRIGVNYKINRKRGWSYFFVSTLVGSTTRDGTCFTLAVNVTPSFELRTHSVCVAPLAN